ncbi:MAG: phosphoribosyltransferase [Cytophagia bacterium]|nr:MAG: phosphoribosyltransferase [Cytophagales bacterium]TAG38107.1 MAG: phosphoribosyltransferase [Cytophagia bacterium]TAG58705.1 MAG: phosphoribosyltransferase [Runella slithyformis]TAG79538.1 MAG: phosphoribosyltransferase [Cytophagales bacterium]
MTENKTTVLNAEQTSQRIKRIAFEIYERNFTESEIILAGIVGEGYQLAIFLAAELAQIASFEVVLLQIQLDKHQPYAHPIDFGTDKEQMAGKVVIVIDDVLNTGRTLAYSLAPLLGVRIKKVQVAVMINRAHHSFPIAADYVGYNVSTTLNEHIQVLLTGPQLGVYLS